MRAKRRTKKKKAAAGAATRGRAKPVTLPKFDPRLTALHDAHWYWTRFDERDGHVDDHDDRVALARVIKAAAVAFAARKDSRVAKKALKKMELAALQLFEHGLHDDERRLSFTDDDGTFLYGEQRAPAHVLGDGTIVERLPWNDGESSSNCFADSDVVLGDGLATFTLNLRSVLTTFIRNAAGRGPTEVIESVAAWCWGHVNSPLVPSRLRPLIREKASKEKVISAVTKCLKQEASLHEGFDERPQKGASAAEQQMSSYVRMLASNAGARLELAAMLVVASLVACGVPRSRAKNAFSAELMRARRQKRKANARASNK